MTPLLSRLRKRLIVGASSTAPGRRGETAKTMAIVVVLTLLIWVYAERAQSGSDKVSLLLTAGTSEPNLIAAIDDPVETPLEISLSGPRGQIEAIKSRLASALEDRRYKIVLSGVESAVGPHVIDAKRLLNSDPNFVNSGVTVTGTLPAEVRVTVDPLKSPEADVVLPPPQNVPVTLLSYSFEPSKVTVSGPQSAFPPGPPTVTVDVSGLTPPNDSGARTIDVPLLPPADRRLKVSETKVKMTYTAGSSVTSGTVASVFIDVVRPVAEEDGRSKVIVTTGNVVHNVQIRGPTNLVNDYAGAQPKRTLRAMLLVNQDDLGRGPRVRELKWPQIEDGAVKVDNGPIEVTFEMREN